MIIIGLVVITLALIYWFCMSSWSQMFGKFPYRIKTKKKVIALTFDDGPNEPYTSKIANYLHEEGVNATFFQVADCVERHPKVGKKLINLGHVVGNHSAHHQFRRYLISLTFDKEINHAQEVIARSTGKTPNLFRPPWLWRTPMLLHNLKKKGLVPVSGEFCHSLEIFQPEPKRIAHAVLAKARPGLIVIFHDGVEGKGGDRNSTYQSLKYIVPELKRRGYTFVTVDRLLDVPAYK